MSSVPCWPAGCPVSCTRMHAPAHALGSCGCSVLLSLVLRVHSRSRSREGKAQGILSDCKVTAAWAAAHVTWCTWGEWSEWGTTNGTAPLTHSRTLWHPSACGRTQRSSSKRAASGRPFRGHPPNWWFDHLPAGAGARCFLFGWFLQWYQPPLSCRPRPRGRRRSSRPERASSTLSGLR